MKTGDAALGAAGGDTGLSAQASRGVGVPESSLPTDVHTAEVSAWNPVFRALGIDHAAVSRVASRAATNGSTVQAELLAMGLCDQTAFFAAVAKVLRVAFVDRLDPEALIIRDRDGLSLLRQPAGIRLVRIARSNAESCLVVAPDADDFLRLQRHLQSNPALARRLIVAAPSTLRDAIELRVDYLLQQRATSALSDALPYCSSRVVATGWQGFAMATLGAFAAAGLVLAQDLTVIGLHLFFSTFFFGCVALRLAAIRRGRINDSAPLGPVDPALMPRYSVLVAVYDEVDMVPELLLALGKLVWPRSKLEIKIVCEADDRATIDAFKAHGLRPWVEIVEVPRSQPRTKPKALAYALQLVSGEFVAVYDAEDKPHPWQLIEAWQQFEASDKDLACLQAPLAISNGGSGMLARMFAFEYSGLFRGILPWLSGNGHILPLGGTSNHFRATALDKMGGWDPFNVTEDADLGIRMRRFGYRTETITYPTYEIAPETWAVWLPQRTRWFKGWMQTWFVHMRNPRRLATELGIWSFAISQVLFAGMVISALIHPFMLATIVWLAIDLASGGTASPLQPPLIALDLANISLGYIAFFLLGRSTLNPPQRRQLWKVALFTPVYWMMQSVAAWRAVAQLMNDPHKWEKTPHPARHPDSL